MRCVLPALTALVLTLLGADGQACVHEARASAVYEEGSQALSDGRYNEAARKFAVADELCPHDVALGEAFRAVEAADDPILCMQLIERGERRGALPEQRAKLKQHCEAQVGQVVVHCPGSTCVASIDGQSVKLHEPTWVLNGEHVVDLEIDGGPVRPHHVVVRSGKLTVVPPANPVPDPPYVVPPPDPANTPPDVSRGMHPAIFFVGLGLTLASGGVLIWSGLDTVSKNDDFKTTPDASVRSHGLDAEIRTNVLVGVTGGLAAVSLVLALFSDWGGEETATPVTLQMDPSRRAGLASWRGSF